MRLFLDSTRKHGISQGEELHHPLFAAGIIASITVTLIVAAEPASRNVRSPARMLPGFPFLR
jgi:hypothetical protein